MKDNQSTMIVRLPNELKHKVELMAEAQGVSLNQFALYTFTKEVVQSEVNSFFSSKWGDRGKKEIFANFDAVVKKVAKKKVPSWDKL